VPELPEVETVVRDLRPLLVGGRLAGVRVSRLALRKKWQPGWKGRLNGRRVDVIHRRGKWIIIVLDDGGHLVVHLGMTGQLTVVPAGTALAPHTHLVFPLDGSDRQLRFRDIRRFGSATYYPDQAALDRAFAEARLGPEPFELRADYWKEQVARTQRSLKALLLDQRVVAGVGNIYADESLFEARLPPSQRGRDTNSQDAGRLRQAVVKVLRRAIDRRGSSIRDYVGGSGLKGEYQDEFRVYGRTGEPCVRCRTPVQSMRLAGRSTHYCPKCQRMV
jgi:formamidopyrimidine-DNA glycosylase